MYHTLMILVSDTHAQLLCTVYCTTVTLAKEGLAQVVEVKHDGPSHADPGQDYCTSKLQRSFVLL